MLRASITLLPLLFTLALFSALFAVAASVPFPVVFGALGALAFLVPADAVLSGPPIIATTEQRAVLQNLKGFISEMPNAFLSRASLRLEQVGGAKNRYRFPILADEGVIRNSERRLSRTDAFFVDRIGMFVAKRNLDKDPATMIPGIGSLDNAVTLYAFPNANIFQDGAEWNSVAAMMNGGTLSLEVDQVKYLQLLDAMGSRFVDFAQTQGLVDGTSATNADGWRTKEVMVPMVPTVRVNGGSSNVLEWAVNEAVDLTGQPITVGEDSYETENVLVVILDGWLAANAGEFQPSRSV